jgi:hypothetical protein
MGVALARRLLHWQIIDPTAAWGMECINAAKLFMLILPQARPVQPLLCVLLAATPPLVPGVIHGGMPLDTAAPRKPLRPALGYLLFAAVVVSVAGARLVVFDAVQAAVGGAPPEGILLGSLVAVAVAALAPLVYCCYSHSVVRLALFGWLLPVNTVNADVEPHGVYPTKIAFP